MLDPWEEKEILIVVKAYPEPSIKYTETVCVAGILREPRMLIRLYPVRFRYMDDSKKFPKYQWIKAKVKKAVQDARPESFNIKEESIVLGNAIPPGKDWSERDRWVFSCKQNFDSFEKLSDVREMENISLAIIKPKTFLEFKIEQKQEDEIMKQQMKKQKIFSQRSMFEEKKDLELMEEKFFLRFKCDDTRCNGHKMSILDWEIAQLYRKEMRKDPQSAVEKVTHKIMEEVCAPSRETYLILGNIAAHQNSFCILGFYYPPKIRQKALPF
ncbi:conserved hypothetical protein [Desulfatibacillum aliphaticivorans]|uniref:Uncharacterized protein n=1 Tax=Desulfatibacillum aliphaticivorans TaxID=218208 RepID=B8FFE9_DESAL|nr:hypothetical protein [Desulfatibacillum aliphaticivorans]ACL04209.1 conserved hypothetical protein [Desulfatibacillum aliphaticivorans]